MIVCSCNVFSDHQLRSVVVKASSRPRMSEIYGGLGIRAQCGRCAHTIKRIMAEMPNWATSCQRDRDAPNGVKLTYASNPYPSV
jgi:bacterioferritin-associated ferredoxin